MDTILSRLGVRYHTSCVEIERRTHSLICPRIYAGSLQALPYTVAWNMRFRVGHAAIATIVTEACQAIWDRILI